MEPIAVPRLLPWQSLEGKSCFLVPGGSGGYLSRLADDMEAVQLATAAEVVGRAREVLDDPMSPYAEVRYAGFRLAECLNDVLRVAESRGLRLPGPDTEAGEGDEGALDTGDAGTGAPESGARP
ncbi:hypothetical protein AB0I77_26620 [Streptomyces sp. NPDC050619]|uniref:hypothetical protein n=1 Tax=Streptomyces sp. NPDC050619 TaxID=3157214 RepID=UPI003419AAE2